MADETSSKQERCVFAVLLKTVDWETEQSYVLKSTNFVDTLILLLAPSNSWHVEGIWNRVLPSNGGSWVNSPGFTQLVNIIQY